MPPSLKIVVLAFGTRGDVQPLAILAAGLHGYALEGDSTAEVLLVTHEQHQSFIEKELWANIDDDTARPTFIATPSPPHAGSNTSGTTKKALDVNVQEVLRPSSHFEVCIEACQGASMLIANLFALEAVHIAEALKLPLMMAHPYPAPTTLPRHFSCCFRMNDPQTYLLLHKAMKEKKEDEQHHPAEVSWLDVEHWMWPVYTDAWSELRKRLGLDETPWLTGRPAIPVLYLYSETVLPRPAYWPEAVEVVGHLWPPDIDTYEPPAALTSFLEAPDSTNTDPQVFAPQLKPILITFGTMVSLGALGSSLDEAVQGLTQSLGFNDIKGQEELEQGTSSHRFIIDVSGQSDWAYALKEALKLSGALEEILANRVFILEDAIPHTWLLPRCSGIVHHGGSGTTAAALRAGIAQVIVPMMMDQFVWAERVAWLELGPPPLAVEAIFPFAKSKVPGVSSSSGSLLDALAKVSHPSTRLRAAAFGRRLRAEAEELRTLSTCVGRIQNHYNDYQRWIAQRPLPQRPPPCPPLPSGCELMILEQQDSGYEIEIAALQGSEPEVIFLHQEIFPPSQGQECAWGYLKHGLQIHDGNTIVDVGANIGLFSLFLDLCVMDEPERIKVIAIEPSPVTCQALQWNLTKFYGDGSTDQQLAKVIPKAVGAAPGRSKMLFYPHMPGNSTLDVNRGPPSGINKKIQSHLEAGVQELEVEVVTLSQVIVEEGLTTIDLLKVDVEGWEEEVLKGLNDDMWPKIRQVVCEVHDVDGRKERINQIISVQGKFDQIIWEKPKWAEGSEMNNWMAYAKRKEDREIASEREWSG